MNGGTGVPEGRTSQRDDPSGNRRVLARTRDRLATGNGNGNQLAIEANGDTLAIAAPPPAKLLGLTNSSSATEAGEEGLNHGKGRTASLCSLERVVRRCMGEATRGTW